jgi:hypothetical protein
VKGLAVSADRWVSISHRVKDGRGAESTAGVMKVVGMDAQRCEGALDALLLLAPPGLRMKPTSMERQF